MIGEEGEDNIDPIKLGEAALEEHASAPTQEDDEILDAVVSEDDAIKRIGQETYSQQQKFKQKKGFKGIVARVLAGAMLLGAVYTAGVFTKDYVVAGHDYLTDHVSSFFLDADNAIRNACSTNPNEAGQDYKAKLGEYNNQIWKYEHSMLQVVEKTTDNISQVGLEQVTATSFNKMDKARQKAFIVEKAKEVGMKQLPQYVGK